MSHKHTGNRSQIAHITLHQTHGQRVRETLQIQQQLKQVKDQIETIRARNKAVSDWVIKWRESIPQPALVEWNQILERYQ